MTACSWCGRRCSASSLDEDADPCCEHCARLAGLEYAADAGRRLRTSPVALRRVSLDAGHRSPRLRAATWDALARTIS